MRTADQSKSTDRDQSEKGDGAQVVANQTADPQNLSRCNYVSEMLLYSKTLIPANPVETVIKRPLNGFSGPNYLNVSCFPLPIIVFFTRWFNFSVQIFQELIVILQ